MKKFFLVSMLSCFSFLGFSQVSPHAIGLRFGGNNGFGTEISYQHGLGNANRLEADLGIRSSNHWDAWQLAGIYQFVFPIEQGFNWYAGAGAGLGAWEKDDSYKYDDEDGVYLFLAGNVGIEYAFPQFPLQLALDTRPQLSLINSIGDNLDIDLALSIRFQF